ncbi:iron chaperone [Alkalibacter mobilis]|uniref:iron chaperone n=1 Tax=Alkalibacter mobilis TaxID=2787712 RepID=UPI00189CA146|nr:iron chaperone [Alkalibacter mobilis]MBF7097562.1 iron chaperone [Alkalibacter mobilis]
METFKEFIESIDNVEHRNRTGEILDWVSKKFPDLSKKIGWNQPMFTDHGTFIIAFSVSKEHLAVAPEKAAIDRFSHEIKAAGYEHTKQLIRIPWNMDIDYSLIKQIIEYNIKDKAEHEKFWR